MEIWKTAARADGKAILKAELQKAQRKEQDYAAMRQNVEDYLSPPQPEQERKKNVELE